MITLYDIKAKDPVKTWSPNPWKARYVLNYKGLPYTTRYLEFPDIEGECKKAGIPPNGKKPDGSPFYTSPSITDGDAGTAIADSYKIAEYLDKQYPMTPKVIPPGSEALQAAFYDQFNQLMSPIWPMCLSRVLALLNPRSVEHFVKTLTASVGVPLDQVEPVGEARAETFGKVKAAFDKLDGWLSKSNGPFFMGETVTFADLVVGAFLQALRVILGESSDDWQELKTWNNGRWIEFLDKLEPYASEKN